MKKLSLSVLLAILTIFTVTGCAKAPKYVVKTISHTATSSAVSAVSSAAASSAPVSSAPAVAPSSAAEAQSSAASETVTLSIDGTNAGIGTHSFTVNLQAGDTVFTVLLRACGNNKIAVRSTGSGSTAFVTALYGMPNSGNNGWIYKINDGTPPNYSCGDSRAAVKANDIIHWVYSTSPY